MEMREYNFERRRIMGKKILVAMDESENALRAARFVADSFTPDHEITLFHVVMDIPAVCDLNSPALHPLFLEQQISLCSIQDKKKELVKQAMAEAKKILREAGFLEKKITFKMDQRKK
jgi:nucleotide-binding universal stress UspA family protein